MGSGHLAETLQLLQGPQTRMGELGQAPVVLFTLLFLLSQEAQCGLKPLQWSPCLKMTSAS